ncbi:EF-hand domain [Trinorchestia longiramus]|nr:EF-hand domain [Trinorchestia longiramus]
MGEQEFPAACRSPLKMDDKAEFVRSIWLRLGVGDDGFLSMADLTKVCHAIGMEDDAKELFTRLDLDGDGRISFAEFQHLFQKRSPEIDFNEGQQPASATAQPPSSPQIVSPLSPSPLHAVWQSDGREKSTGTKPGRGGSSSNSSKGTSRCAGTAGISRSLDEQPNAGALAPLLLPSEAAGTSPRTSTRTVAVWRVLQQWESYGIRDGRGLLHYLGLPSSPSEEITLHDLVAAVEEECTAAAGEEQHLADRKTASVLTNKRALCSLLLLETKHLRTAVESACCERDKLRADLAHTSHRLSSQAQELDDHTMALEATAHQHIQSVEKQHQEAVRALQERLYSEREAREQACVALSDANMRADHLQEQLSKTRTLLTQTEQACERLESENCELTTKLSSTRSSLADAQALNARLQHREKQQQQDEHDAAAEGGDSRRKGVTSGDGAPDDAEWRELCAQLAKLRHDNQALRDSNDELQARVEQLTLHQPSRLHSNICGADISLDGSCMGDYLLPATLNGSQCSSVLASPPPAAAPATPATAPASCPSFSDQHQQPNSMPAVWGTSSTGLKRPAVGGGEEGTWSSPCDVSSAGRRNSPDLLSPRAGKIARCASSPPPPYSSSGARLFLSVLMLSSLSSTVLQFSFPDVCWCDQWFCQLDDTLISSLFLLSTKDYYKQDVHCHVVDCCSGGQFTEFIYPPSVIVRTLS